MAHRNTTTRDRHRRIIGRDKPPCALCGSDIDYTLRYPYLECFVVDHVVPVNKGGLDELENKQAAHNRCNRLKSDLIEGEQPAVLTFVTVRTW